MKFVFPGINKVFDTEGGRVNTIIIENQRLLVSVINDLLRQISGLEGEAVLSNNDEILSFVKNAELINDFFPFVINKKALLNKAMSVLVNRAVENDYERTSNMLSQLEDYLFDQANTLVGDIYFQKINMEAILRSVGMSFNEDYSSLGEKIIDYFELVREYDRDKLFVLINLRSFMEDKEANMFFDTVIRHQYHVVLIDNCEHTCYSREKRYIIDKDLCEISC